MSHEVIGIISYLPDDTDVRKARFEKLCKLIETCNQLFDLPIYIVTQNYTEEEQIHLYMYKNIMLSDNYVRCGIVGARKKLREWFLLSNYECLIMLDDDCVITGDKEGAKRYLSEIKNHPSAFGEFRGSQLKLFSITKDLIAQVDYTDINPEDAEGFEDTIFVEILRHKFSNKRFVFNKYEYNLRETSSGAKDSLSTWYKDQNLKDMLAKTAEEVNKL